MEGRRLHYPVPVGDIYLFKYLQPVPAELISDFRVRRGYELQKDWSRDGLSILNCVHHIFCSLCNVFVEDQLFK